MVVHECRKQLLVADRESGLVHAFQLHTAVFLGAFAGTFHDYQLRAIFCLFPLLFTHKDWPGGQCLDSDP